MNTCLLAILRPLRTVYEAPMVLKRLFWADLLCWMRGRVEEAAASFEAWVERHD